MQFQVPQFIDVSPKIVGPLTLKQFLIIVSAAAPLMILFFILNFFLWIILVILIGGPAVAIALVKIKGRPLLKILTAGFNYFWQPRFYLWRRVDKSKMAEVLKQTKTQRKRPHLKDLFLKLTTSTHPIEKREKPSKFLSVLKSSKEKFQVLRKTTGEREKARRIDYR